MTTSFTPTVPGLLARPLRYLPPLRGRPSVRSALLGIVLAALPWPRVAGQQAAGAPPAGSQAGTPATTSVDAAALYRASAPAVFLIELRGTGPTVLGIGSAFLISADQLVTNAHVVQGGRPTLRTGAVSLPLSVERLDPVQDLAVLRSATPLDAKPLVLATHEPAVGTSVVVLGNPQGLERSISEGLIAGVRERAGRPLLQLTAAISPGSSGGPVLGRDGAVVGVTVGYLEGGQNLNFAVPVSRLRALLARQDAASSSTVAALEEALAAVRLAYAAPPPPRGDSVAWAHRFTTIQEGLDRAASLAPTGAALLQVAVLADSMWEKDRAARFALDAMARDRHLADSARAVAITGSRWDVLFADSTKTAELRQYLALADSQLAHRPRDGRALSFRSAVLEKLGRSGEAIVAIRRAIEVGAPGGRDDWQQYHRFVAKYSTAGDDDAVFARMQAQRLASAYDWGQHAEHLSRRVEWEKAAEAYVTAYRLAEGDDSSRPGYACGAGRMYLLTDAPDRALDALRTCLSGYAGASWVDTSDVVFAHRGIAGVLNDRNVFGEAESRAREALRLDPTDAWAAYEHSRALQGAGRLPEALRAAEAAVRLSDGRFYSMHFQAGSVAFDQEDWPRCARAFHMAAELSPRNDAAKYNEALCLARQGYYSDAAQAMEEVLVRNPRRTDRADILRKIALWRH